MTEDEAWAALASVIDPEVGIDIVELGLIYGMVVSPSAVVVTMTLTTPGCPLHEVLVGAVEDVLIHAGAPSVDVDLVWDPPWSPDLIGARGRAALGDPRMAP